MWLGAASELYLYGVWYMTSGPPKNHEKKSLLNFLFSTGIIVPQPLSEYCQSVYKFWSPEMTKKIKNKAKLGGR